MTGPNRTIENFHCEVF